MLSKEKLIGSKGHLLLPAIFAIHESDFYNQGSFKDGMISFIQENLNPELIAKYKMLFQSA